MSDKGVCRDGTWLVQAGGGLSLRLYTIVSHDFTHGTLMGSSQKNGDVLLGVRD